MFGKSGDVGSINETNGPSGADSANAVMETDGHDTAESENTVGVSKATGKIGNSSTGDGLGSGLKVTKIT